MDVLELFLHLQDFSFMIIPYTSYSYDQRVIYFPALLNTNAQATLLRNTKYTKIYSLEYLQSEPPSYLGYVPQHEYHT